jgi:hypothetical protein
VKQGEFVGVIGHTGSGKSTLMQHLNGLLKPTKGQVLLDGKDIWSNKSFTRQCRFRIGLVFQYPEYQLFEETVYKDIAFGPKNMGLKPEEVDRRVREAAGFVGLTEQQLRERSHRPQDFYGQPHFMPAASDGAPVVWLNRCRCAARRAELAACQAFGTDRGDIVKALNRMSSSIYLLMIEEKAKQGEH